MHMEDGYMGSESGTVGVQEFPSHTLEEVFPEELKRKELPQPFVNVGKWERWGSGILGAALALHGIRRGSWAGFLTSAVGGSLIYRGVTGHCDAYKAMGINTVKS